MSRVGSSSVSESERRSSSVRRSRRSRRLGGALRSASDMVEAPEQKRRKALCGAPRGEAPTAETLGPQPPGSGGPEGDPPGRAAQRFDPRRSERPTEPLPGRRAGHDDQVGPFGPSTISVARPADRTVPIGDHLDDPVAGASEPSGQSGPGPVGSRVEQAKRGGTGEGPDDALGSLRRTEGRPRSAPTAQRLGGGRTGGPVPKPWPFRS